jgi:nucleotide-binding universal stress UspA family protein
MYRRILFAHDGTDAALAAVPHLAVLARPASAELILCHVVAESVIGGASHEDLPVAVLATRRALEAIPVDGVSTMVLQGRPGRALAAAVEETATDLVVLLARRRGGIARVLSGSTAQELLAARHGAPILVVGR